MDAVRSRMAGGERLRTSPALVLAARELARGAAAGVPDPVSPPRLRAALAGALAFDPAPAALLVVADPASAPSALAERVSAPAGATHLGVGALEHGGRTHLVLLVSARKATLEPFPRDVSPGATVAFRARLAGLDGPELYVTPPSGRSAPVDARRTAGGAISASIRFDVPGRWVVEVLGRGARGPEVAALLVVSSGGASLVAALPADPPDPADDREAEERVARALNETRRAAGLPPLSLWPELSAVARRHSAAMLAAGVVAHRLPGSEDAGVRLRQAHLPFASVLENVAKGPGALLAHRLIEESPAHRQNVLSPVATRLGCGIARGPHPSGGEVVYLTELFVEPVEDGSGERVRPETRVREVVWRERARAGSPPLHSDPWLDDLARGAAVEMLRAGRAAPEHLAEKLLQGGRKVAAADGFVVAKAVDVTRSRNLADARFRRVGVGVAIGDHPRYGSGLLWIAIVYTD